MRDDLVADIFSPFVSAKIQYERGSVRDGSLIQMLVQPLFPIPLAVIECPLRSVNGGFQTIAFSS